MMSKLSTAIYASAVCIVFKVVDAAALKSLKEDSCFILVQDKAVLATENEDCQLIAVHWIPFRHELH